MSQLLPRIMVYLVLNNGEKPFGLLRHLKI